MTTRRHFLEHVGGLASLSVTSSLFGQKIIENSSGLRKDQKAAILIWLSGGPPTIDMWDLKPGTNEGGPSRPINTTGDFQISEHMPLLAKQGDSFSIVRSMSTREADHGRGRYMMHTGFVPNPRMVHPSMGSVVASELGPLNKDLEIPAFFSIDTNSYGGGFLGTAWNPFSIRSNGTIPNLGGDNINRNRLRMLSILEDNFIKSNRGEMPSDHKKLLEKTFKLNTSPQMDAIKIQQEPAQVIEAYGNTGLGRGALIARRLIQQGVPFVEVGFGGWDLHQMTHETLATKLPQLDKVVSTLMLDLKRLDMWDNVAIVMMGEFGRTPRINQNAGRDHWAASWSAFVSGGLFKGGQAIGKTSADGKQIDGKSYTASELMSTTLTALGIDTNKKHTSKSGRPIRIANGGAAIKELI
tara:strand:- start:2492 stop:3724 length:1233 start_codon:yes stop_codon:yes gene_type:complete